MADNKRIILAAQRSHKRLLDECWLAAVELVRWPVGKPGRERCEQTLHNVLKRLRFAYQGDPATLDRYITEIQRRAMHIYNNETNMHTNDNTVSVIVPEPLGQTKHQILLSALVLTAMQSQLELHGINYDLPLIVINGKPVEVNVEQLIWNLGAIARSPDCAIPFTADWTQEERHV